MSDSKVDVLIVGAGLCGLSAGMHLSEAGSSFLVVEREHEVGGLARTESYDGFSFDHSIHILYTANEYAADLITERLLPDNLGRQQRHSYCYSYGAYTEYPYQINNFGLPADVVVANIMGLVEARSPQAAADPGNYEEWIYATFGRGIADNFMIPYNRRQWAWDLKEMHFDWIAERVPVPQVEEVLRGALEPPKEKFGPNREFWYPQQGGIESLSLALAEQIPASNLRLSCSVRSIDPVAKVAVLDDGSSVGWDRLISTVPVPRLVELLVQPDPEIVKRAGDLNNNIVHTVNLGFEGDSLGIDQTMHWVYYPLEGTIFHRLSFPHAFSSWMAPEGCSSIQAEISQSRHKPLEGADFIRETLDGLVSVGILEPREAKPVEQGGRVRVAEVVTLDPAYIIYDLNHPANTAFLKQWLLDRGIETRGRFGEWEYFNMDHSILSGKEAADASVAALT